MRPRWEGLPSPPRTPPGSPAGFASPDARGSSLVDPPDRFGSPSHRRDAVMERKITGTWHDDPAHFRRPTRRAFLHVGLVGGLGLTLDQFFRLQAHADPAPAGKQPPAQSVIHIFLPGGMAHQESFDPKPYAPIEYRGEMATIQTRIDGAAFNECLKQTAQLADKITVCRSMTHGEAAHERGTHNMFTGYRPSPALQFPSLGSVVSHEYGPRNNLPPYVC